MPENKIKKTFYQGLLSAFLILSVIPGFELIGNLFLQVAVTVICTLIIIFLADFLFKTDADSVSNSLITTVLFWVIFALYKQIELHITNNDKTFRWLINFYYDKPALIFVVLFVCVLYYIFKLMLSKKDSFVSEYKIGRAHV